MSNTIKVLINEDGITGREQNPFGERAKNTTGTIGELLEMFEAFESTVKSYTVIGSGFKAGDVVECQPLDWYCKEKRFNNNPVQIIEAVKDGFEYENILDIISNSEFLHLDFFEAYKVVEAKENKPEKSDDYKQGYVHGLDNVAENDRLKIKRLEATIEMLRLDNYERFIDSFEYETLYTKQDIKRIVKSI